jgi:hypothetical protein
MDRTTWRQSVGVFVVTLAAGLPFAIHAGQLLAGTAEPARPRPMETARFGADPQSSPADGQPADPVTRRPESGTSPAPPAPTRPGVPDLAPPPAPSPTAPPEATQAPTPGASAPTTNPPAPSETPDPTP